MKVYLVFEDVMYEGSWLKSAWTTHEGAEQEAIRLTALDPAGEYRVQEVEVRQ